MSTRAKWRVAAWFGLVLLWVGQLHTSGSTIFLSGDSIPGSSRTWSGFIATRINDAGHVLVYGHPGSTSHHALVAGAPGNLSLLGSTYDGPWLGNSNSFALDDTVGNVLYATSGGGNAAIRRFSPETGVTPWMTNGNAAPGTAGAEFSSFSNPAYQVGNSAFTGRLADGVGDVGTNESDHYGIWHGNTPTLLVRGGDPMPGVAGATFTGQHANDTPFGAPQINAGGIVAFTGKYVPGDWTTRRSGLWTGTPGDISLIAYNDVEAPDGSYYNIDGYRDINFGAGGFSGDNLAFAAFTRSAPGVWPPHQKVFTGDPSNPASFDVIATADRQNFVEFSGVVINNQGTVAFHRVITADASDDASIWLGDATELALVAREGATAPGSGAVFNAFSTSLLLNDNGQVAFVASLTGTGVDSGNDLGLFATNPHGTLLLLARKGDDYWLGEGDVRTISNIRLSSGSFAAGGGYGELIYMLDFDDDTFGVFTTLVPEPSAVVLLGLGALMLNRRRISHRS